MFMPRNVSVLLGIKFRGSKENRFRRNKNQKNLIIFMHPKALLQNFCSVRMLTILVSKYLGFAIGYRVGRGAGRRFPHQNAVPCKICKLTFSKNKTTSWSNYLIHDWLYKTRATSQTRYNYSTRGTNDITNYVNTIKKTKKLVKEIEKNDGSMYFGID